MSEIKYFTKEGLEKLKKELHEMQTKGRADMSRQIAEAREKGDLSENAEYDAAKEAQGLLEMRIAKLENELANARIADDSIFDTSKALILSYVRFKNYKINREFKYQLVSESEADLKANKISVKSPIGEALLGKSIGDVFDVKTPAGNIKIELLEISRD
ncbi:MAG: transcription elongation factor GreA [Chitinophagales bacterium]|nr:transcription elongation factor GreA [Bacteroidota bacterium]MCB9043215.1 transcription elongation factor GreA [Chitinophagales bacterium]